MTKNLFRLTFVLLFFILVFTFFGCRIQKNIPPEKISKIPNWKNLYYFHAGDSNWIVKPVPTAGNKFSGIIYKPDEVKKNRQVHIYADPLSAVIFEQGRISVPVENIVKVENYKIRPGIIILAAGVVVLLFLIPTVL